MKKQDEIKPMTEKMLKFCEYYLETRNATQSYAKAYGYDIESEKGREKNYATCGTSGPKLLKDPRINNYIQSKMRELDYETELNEQEITMQLTKMALGSHYKENIRLEALKTLAKMKGMFEDEEANKEATVNIQIGNDIKDVLKKAEK